MSKSEGGAALRERFKALQAAPPKPVEVDGIGLVYVRPLTLGDVLDAEDIREGFAKASDGKISRQRSAAIGLAQVICDASGALIFDPRSADDVDLIAGLSWASIRGLMGISGAQEGDEKKI